MFYDVMSKTYKHQNKYRYEHYDWSKSYGRIILTHDGYIHPPLPEKDIHRPDEIKWGYWADNTSKQFVEQKLQRKFRHKVKRLIHQGKFDLLPLKPESSAWILW